MAPRPSKHYSVRTPVRLRARSIARTFYLLENPFVGPARELHIRGAVREAVGHLCIAVRIPPSPCGVPTGLTNIREVFQHRALHGQLVQVGIQERGNALRLRRGSFLSHFRPLTATVRDREIKHDSKIRRFATLYPITRK